MGGKMISTTAMTMTIMAFYEFVIVIGQWHERISEAEDQVSQPSLA